MVVWSHNALGAKRSHRPWSVAAVFWLGCTSAGLAQTPQSQKPQSAPLRTADFDTRLPPRGTVHDDQGQPVAGARVRFRIERDNLDAVHWRNHVLRKQPLPQVRTSRDGEFFLPLTSTHRLFTRQTAGRISLLVEKDGYHPWVEPLTTGLRGYLGSAVVLRKVRPEELLQITVAQPRPGMLVRVHRFTSSAAAHLDYEQFLPVPASGKLTAAMSFVPKPLTLGTLNNLVLPVGIEVQLIHPEHTTAPVRIQFGQRAVAFGAKSDVLPVEVVCSLGRRDGKPLVQPRGLYRAPDGVSRWFPVDPDRVVESKQLVLVAVTAEGCLAVNVPYVDPSIEKILLQPVREAPVRRLRLLDARGAKVAQAQVYFFGLEALPENMDPRRMTHLRARRRLRAEDGMIDLAAVKLPGPGFLFVHAQGLKPAILFEPRSVRGTQRLSLGRPQRFGKVEITVTDAEGNPVPGAQFVMNARSFELGAFNGRPPRTDKRGMVTIEFLGTGRHSIQVIGPGISQAMISAQLRRSGEVVKQAVTVSRTHAHRVVLVDDQKRPVPFAAVRVFGNANEAANIGLLRTSMRTNSSLAADSRGRILLTDYPRAVQAQMRDLFQFGAQPAAALDPSERINKVAVGRTEAVVMPLPKALVTKECFTIDGRSVSRTVPKAEGGAMLLARFPLAQEGVLSIYLERSAPMRLTADLIETARGSQKQRPLVLDQRQLTRKVQLRIGGIDLSDTREIRFETSGLNFRGDRPYLYGDTGLRLRQTGATWEVAVRDGEPFQGWLLHPRALLKQIEVPRAKAGQAPTEVKLEPGTGIEVFVQSRGKILPSSKIYFYVHSTTNEMLLYQHETVGAAAVKLPDGRWRFRSPVGFAPGEYRLTLRILGTSVNMSRRQFRIPENGSLQLSLVDRKVQQIGKPASDGGKKKAGNGDKR